MTEIIRKVLITIRRFAKTIGGNFVLFNFYDYIQEINSFSQLLIGKTKGWDEICKDLPKTYHGFPLYLSK